MATIASKIQWTTAAVAVAAAATLAPVAFADPADPDNGDTAGAAVGSSAGQAPSRSTRKDRTRPEVGNAAPQTGGSESTGGASPESGGSIGESTGEASPGRASTNVTAPAPTANATPPLVVGEDVTIIEGLLVADPDLQRATFGWLKDLDINACVLGLSQSVRGSESVAIGPYATSTLAYSTEGCG
jgi:hypothetical protein